MAQRCRHGDVRDITTHSTDVRLTFCGAGILGEKANPVRPESPRFRQADQQFSLWPLRSAPGSLGTYGFLTPPYGLPYGLELKNNPRLCTSLRVYASNTPQEAARRQSENCRAPKAKMRIAEGIGSMKASESWSDQVIGTRAERRMRLFLSTNRRDYAG